MSRSFCSEASTCMASPVLVINHRTCHLTVYCFSLKMLRTCGSTQACSLSRLKPGLHVVVTIAEHACDHVLNGVLKLLIYRSEAFLVKYKHLRSLQLCEDQGILGKLKKCVRNLVLAILTTYMETRLKSCSKQKWKERWWATLTRIIKGVYSINKDCIKSSQKNHRSW